MKQNWTDIHNNVLLRESTTFILARLVMLHHRSYNNLTGIQDVTMPDVKDGFLGLRVSHELEIPSKKS